MLSASLDSSFSIPLTPLNPSQITGESDVGVGFDTSDQFVGDGANVSLKYLSDIERLSKTDWPLVLTGSSGTGKTALGLSIASALVRKSGQPAAIFTADGFRRRFAAAVDTNSVDHFHQSLAATSVLLIDNLQLLSGYDAAQDELNSILDQFIAVGLPVIVTVSDRFLEPDCLSHRLVSRLSQGLCMNVCPPGEAARQTIITEYGMRIGLSFDLDAVNYLASQLKLTYPKIKSFLVALANWLESDDCDQFTGSSVSKELISNYLITRKQSNLKVIDFIIQQVARSYKLKPVDIKSNSRKQTIVLARGVAIYLLRNTLGISFAKIGEVFGGRDHSTIMHAAGKITSLLENGSLDLIENINRIEQSIQEKGVLNVGTGG